jgi:molybdate transport system regulatory protein
MPHTSNFPGLVGRLSLVTATNAHLGGALDERRIRLLEAIDRYGSVAQGARAVPMSYRAAREALDAMGSLTVQPLVESTVGGRDGGGTRLTAHARRLIALYRAVANECQEVLDQLTGQCNQLNGKDDPAFRTLLRHLSMRASTRNRFVGTVQQLSIDSMRAEAKIRLDDTTQLTALLTRESAETLALRPGAEVHALIEATAVLLGVGEGLRTSASNHLWGTISRIREGAAEADVTLRLSGGLNLAALISRAALERLQLKPGCRACAVFRASSVVLVGRV